MDNPNATENTQRHFDDIEKVLINYLEKLSESFSKSIYALPAIDGHDECELEQQLKRERENHMGKRIIFIPYCLGNSHWIGILIKFEDTGQILRAEYMDPVNDSNDVPDKLQKQIAKVYQSVVLQPNDLFKNNDPQLSSKLSIKNLLTVVEYYRYPDPSITHNQKEGNEYELSELEQKLKDGLQKLKISHKKIKLTSSQTHFPLEDDFERKKKKLCIEELRNPQ